MVRINKNVQIKVRGENDWEYLYPRTKSSLVDVDGITLDEKLKELENSTAIVVSPDVPENNDELLDGSIWYQEIRVNTVLAKAILGATHL